MAGAVAGWVPGQGATRLPEGLGMRVPAGSHLIAQVHYNTEDPARMGP